MLILKDSNNFRDEYYSGKECKSLDLKCQRPYLIRVELKLEYIEKVVSNSSCWSEYKHSETLHQLQSSGALFSFITREEHKDKKWNTKGKGVA